ncbi:virulence factor Mce family protein [Mycobacterium helveticum]|uniref:Virulence factor Mce family protein n=1 Tax=Mycobacterium helveticum TaxID=2592811 RepID=A0A557XP51_9MYCO|nr:virulence factor Mce family protein [Mycobacterium helveticum]TVS87654.1 virulence factor Mce family protein [Mycobacterium helveticum]
MNRARRWSRAAIGLVLALALTALSGCGFRGANSFPLPGTKGGGPGSYTVQAQMPDVQNLERNSRVRVNDVTVGKVTNIELQGWHAVVTMAIDGGVDLPGNATATVGQTSLLGSVHVELAAPPTGVPPEGKLKNGSLIPMSSAGTYPSTERTLAAVSLVLNGGGLGQIQDITKSLSTAFTGREADLRSLLGQLDKFVGYLNDQKGDIIAATDSLNNLVGQFADQKPVIDKALKTIPNALTVLKDERNALADALGDLSRFGALAADSVNKTKENLVKELKDLGPVLQSLADAGPALTRALDFYGTFPFPTSTLSKWMRGDYANLTAVIDLTLSRLDASFFTGTRFECNLSELELQWGRTIGQMPSPCMGGSQYNPGNPLVVPYHFDQGR